MTLSRTQVDRLGQRLCDQVRVDDLLALDAWRREFRVDHDHVVGVLRHRLALQVSSRPAKSTQAIIGKLKRGSTRLSQMQDIAGCRTVVPDLLVQDEVVQRIEAVFASVERDDRRLKPSHGYRAVHVIVRSTGRPIEIQIRTQLQHLWAQFSEVYADRFGPDLKYGVGNETALRNLGASSQDVAALEVDEAAARLAGTIDSTEFARRRGNIEGRLRLLLNMARFHR